MKDQDNSGQRAAQSSFFQRFQRKAEEYINKPSRLKDLINDSYKKATEQKDIGTIASDVWEGFQQLTRMIKASVSGEYQGIEKKTIIGGIAVLLYLLSPIDLVPDFIPVLGLLDDAALLAWFLTGIKTELDHFVAWEASQPAAGSAGGDSDQGPKTNDTSDQRPKYGNQMEDTNATSLRSDRTAGTDNAGTVRSQTGMEDSNTTMGSIGSTAGGGEEKLLIKDFTAMDQEITQNQPSSSGTASSGGGEADTRNNTTDSTRLPKDDDSNATSGGNVR